MAETGKIIAQQQDAHVWEGLQQYRHFPEWFISIRDSHRLTRVLSTSVPEFRPGPWRLKDCLISHIRYQNGFISALYKLVILKPGELTDTTIDLQGRIFSPGKFTNTPGSIDGKLGAEDWHAVLPALNLELESRQPDIPLAALDSLTDPEKSRKYLEDYLQAHYPNIKIKASSPRVVRYNRGDRCTIVYHLEYEDQTARKPEWPQTVVVKTYHGTAGKNAFESMLSLWNSPLVTSKVVKIAEPLAYRPETRVLIQGTIPEEKTLEALLGATVKYHTPELIQEFNHAMYLTAQGLAALHNCGVQVGGVWSWKDQMNLVRRQVKHLAVGLPELFSAAVPLLEWLDQLAGQTTPDPLVPTHGTFRTPQVLLSQGEIGFIDFDSFRQSEPADDLALFLGEMLNFGLTQQDRDARGVRKPLDKQAFEERFEFLMAAHDQFLEIYQRLHPVTYQRVILWEALDMFSFILHDWAKLKMSDLDSTVDLLQRFALRKFR